MIKYIILITTLLTNYSLQAQENKNDIKKEKKYITSTQFYDKIFSDKNTILAKNSNTVFKNIDNNAALNDYKKYLLNSITTFHILIAKDYNDQEQLIKHAKNFFPITICFSYQFDKDSSRQIEQINKDLFNTQELINQFNIAQNYVFENFLQEKQKSFFKNIEKDFFVEKCSD